MKLSSSKFLISILIPYNIIASLIFDKSTSLTYINFKGSLNNLVICVPNRIIISLLKDKFVCALQNINSKTLALINTLVKQIHTRMHDVSNYVTLKLFLEGIGYKATLIKSNNLELEVGYSHKINLILPSQLHVEVTANGTCIILKGNDSLLVSRIGSIIKSIRHPELYKGKGIRRSYDIIKLKQSKK